MSGNLNNRFRWWIVAVYAVAMAWVEAAVVYDLRTMVDRIEPHQPNPLPIVGGLGRAELVREMATLVTLLAVGTLAGRSWRSRLGYVAIAFGFWDIFYYIFLKVLCGWPHSVFDWDVLFLMPLPWWGPVLAPVLISILMVVWGTLVTSENAPTARQKVEVMAWATSGIGVIIALCVFMADTLRVANLGVEAVRNVLPTSFNWVWFCVSLTLMAAPVSLALARTLFWGGENTTANLAQIQISGTLGVPAANQCCSQSGRLLVVAADRNV
jgi:hypothetical protein